MQEKNSKIPEKRGFGSRKHAFLPNIRSLMMSIFVSDITDHPGDVYLLIQEILLFCCDAGQLLKKNQIFLDKKMNIATMISDVENIYEHRRKAYIG